MTFDEKRFLVGVFAICALFRGGLAVELKIEVPEAVLKGHEVVLKCLFDLEGDKLYSVKWYHNSREFFRYTLNGIHSVKQFNLRGFHIEEDRSNATQVVLKHATRAINGQFSCEVTEDQPSFYTEMKTASLEVVDPPSSDPVIVGTRSKYKIGDYLKAMCTSEKSDPPVNMTWHMNGRIAEGPRVRRYKKTIEGNYISTYSTLQFIVTEDLFKEGGEVKLRCTANLHDLWQRTAERTIELKMPKQLETDEAAPSWAPTPTTSTDFSHEKYWLFVAGTTVWSGTGNGTSSSDVTYLNKAMFLLSMFVFAR